MSRLSLPLPVALTSVLIAATLTACGGSSDASNDSSTPPTPPPSNTVFTPLASDLSEPADWYANQTLDVIEVHLRTVPGSGPCIGDDPSTVADEEDYSGCTLNNLRDDEDGGDAFDPFVPVHVSQPIEFPHDGSVTNAELEIRGATSRLATQKSWKVKLDSKDVLWRQQRRLQLNKHPWELARVRNKLSFDLFQSIPHLPSLRTQFVQLHLDDNGGGAQDFGLFTHVEHVGKEYLLNRGWDKDSGLYKAENFTFRQRAGFALDPATGEPLDLNAFERRVEIKRGDSHFAFERMIAAINGLPIPMSGSTPEPPISFDAAFERHFNRNNYLTWLAVNILTGNWDTQSQNFYLYNPLDSERFYFTPWDYDGAWGWDQQPDQVAANKPERRWSRGVSNWWDVKLHKFFLQQPGSLALLNEAVAEIRDQHFQPAQIQARLDSYRDLIRPLVAAAPDNTHLPVPAGHPTPADKIALWDADYAQIAAQVQRNHDDFIALQESPMPFWIDTPVVDGANLNLSWDASQDLQGDAVSYELYLSDNPADIDSKPLVAGLVEPRHSIALPASGSWYLKVIARDASNPQDRWQIAFDTHWEGSDRYHGVRAFAIP